MKLHVATPCHGGVAHVNYVRSMLNLSTACNVCGVDLYWDISSGESAITRNRNECVARFLESDATDFMFIDADIGFEPEEVFRLLGAPYDVAAGVYCLKNDGAGFAADPADVGEIDKLGFARIREVPTGFLRIKREVFLQLINNNRDGLRYKLRDGRIRYRFFENMICPETQEYLTEDYAFCRLCEKTGIKVYVDTNSKLEHQGLKRYVGDFRAAVEHRV
jgi:glycosyltransferase involved in cell wall biosynthesis